MAPNDSGDSGDSADTREQWNDPDFARAWIEANSERPHSPLREEQLDLLLAILRAHIAATGAHPHILDVGCGAGIVAERVLRDIPGATVAGVDASPPMLAMARERLAPYAERVTLAQADFETMTPDLLPSRPYDAAFAVQAIHNCSDDGKRRTYASIRAALTPGGLFVLSDRVRLATPALFSAYRALWGWLDARFTAAGTPWHTGEGATYAEHEQSVSARGDNPGSIEQNLLWLREAGFAEVAAPHVAGIRAVIVAVAPA